jgi:hypothetical protein
MEYQPASIWKMEAIQELANHEAVEIHSFDQCTQGQISTKPTPLLLLRLPGVALELRRAGKLGRCNHKGGHAPLKGKLACGSFKTAPAKVYPPALCAILARGFLTHCAQLIHRGAVAAGSCPEELRELHMSTITGSTFVADYHGPASVP